MRFMIYHLITKLDLFSRIIDRKSDYWQQKVGIHKPTETLSLSCNRMQPGHYCITAKSEETLSEFEHTQQSCLAYYREISIKKPCNCFSESYSIPYSERHIGLQNCLIVDQTTSNVIKMREIRACVEKIENMADAEFGFRKSTLKPQ